MLKAISSITNALGALNYKGTWDANANIPALASSVGTKGDYYVVATAGSTTLNGISNWGIGDWAAFNGSVWQRVEGGADLNGVNLTVSGTSTLSGNAIISVSDNTNAALRITQIGTDNALLVEDATNPDTTPFVINNNGVVTAGYTTTVGFGSASQPIVNIVSVSNDNGGGLLLSKFRNSAVSSSLDFIKSRSSTIGTNTIVGNGDNLGTVLFSGADGTSYINAASIVSAVDGTPGVNDMPGRLVFSTTADGASSVTERMRIDSAGGVGIGGAASAGTSLQIAKSITGSTVAWNLYNIGTIQSDVTSQTKLYVTNPSTAAAVFTLNNLTHYFAQQGTIGAGSTVTNQYGFEANNTLIGAANNYGFFGNIAAAANRWNFYANGTARNYMAADLTVNGATAIPAGGTAGAGLMVSTTANFGVFFGSGAPTLSAAKGSLYLRSDGSTVNDRMYVNTNGSTTWTSVVTSA